MYKTAGIGQSLPDWVQLGLPFEVEKNDRDAIISFTFALAGLLKDKKYDRLSIDFFPESFHISQSDDLEADVEILAGVQGAVEIAHALTKLNKHLFSCKSQVRPGRPSHKVFNLDKRFSPSNSGRDDDTSKRLKATMDRLVRTGGEREMVMPPEDWRTKIDALEAEFPNFSGVVKTIVSPHLGIVKKGGQHRMSPVLLVGPPGVGKTFFANALAKMLGFNSALFIDFSSETNGGALAGSSVFWSNSNPGKLFDCLAWGTAGDRAYANPVVILDEIDKISGSETYNPHAALYGILESETAARFQDQAVPDVIVDVSRVRFFLTANDPTKIPEPLLSRVTVFHIQPPTEEQLRGVVRNIYGALAEEIGLGLPRRLSEEMVDMATGISPREAKVRLECAIAKAVSAGRKTIRPSDWPVIPTAASQKRKIGF